ncbi:type II CRISPR RNA-guided endonuclease Cas9 [Lagierella sp.]|uniref:type II CRISPR RNA-guided endonuclease Cas9 n=1 Tax=Lagierella sp. TaxID=2849657 RepID=UPI002625A22B|nr:type II CRISPR RNA-guided endonuclease Cas9 [Lagierella sp.]
MGKETRKNKDYYLGLDIGTNSVGWAVTDESYNILRAKGKDAWGIRLFSEAKTAEERRLKRSSRRRYQRTRLRLDMLREIFQEEINKIDKDFFLRLDESKFWFNDKKINCKYNLFDDVEFSDRDYHLKYPTIYHLRKDLMDSKEKKDIRFYFLAINHIMKKRGHFLNEGQKISEIENVEPYFKELKEILNKDYINVSPRKRFFIRLLDILSDKNTFKNDKKNQFKSLLKDEKINNKIVESIGNILISGNLKLSKLYDLELDKENDEKVDFNNEEFEEKIIIYEQIVGDKIDLILNLKGIYDYVLLKNILNGHKTISDAKVSRFVKHKEDLEKLKILIRKYDNSDKKLYNEMFRKSNVKNNYKNYITKVVTKGKIKPKCSREDFYKFVLKMLDEICDKSDELFQEIKNDIEKEEFMLKQVSNLNSVIPYQIHEIELNKILNSLIRDYPGFEKETKGLSKKEKIQKLFKFRIPYYVGPLNPYHNIKNGGNSWIVLKKNTTEQITPWNFEDIVDLDESEKEFIRSMTNKCTYLIDKDVLAKHSLLYSKYLVLNELNNLKINGTKLDRDLKLEIIEELYAKNKKVSLNKLKTFLVSRNYADSDVLISGIDNELKENMSSYVDFKRILGDEFDELKVENLIEYITIHSGNKKIIRKKINKLFPYIENEKKKMIESLKYEGWGRFSNDFLKLLKGVDNETGEINSIIGFLLNKNDNLMQLLSRRYTFLNEIKEYNGKFFKGDFSYGILEKLRLSPSVKKMVWQTLIIVEEIKKVFGSEPKKIFIEMSRGKEDKPERKESRKSNLVKLYSSLNKDILQEIKNRDEIEFRKERLFLYYTQNCKCMYSGETIDLNKIMDSNLYDVDHIIPRSIKKDDSVLNNKVLVKRILNKRKGNKYPIAHDIRNNPSIKKMWEFLLAKGLITEEKFNRLIRNSPLTDEELAGFINRQLVETRQTTKITGELLKDLNPQSKLVYVKAGLISEFRHNFNCLKVRDLDNLHHAHDAFLNVVVGNVYNTKFTNNPLNYVKNNRGSYSLNRIFDNTVIDINGNVVWDNKRDIQKVLFTLEKNSVLKTVENYISKGQLFNEQPISKEEIKESTLNLPLKEDSRLANLKRYGGYTKIGIAYFALVSSKIRKKDNLSLEGIPKYLVPQIYQKGEKVVLDFLTTYLGLEEVEILIPKILIKSQIIVDGFKYTINGKTGNKISIQPAVEPFWSLKEKELYKYLLGLKFKSESYNKDITIPEDREKIVRALEIVKNKLNKKPFNNRKTIPSAILEYDFINSSLENLDMLLVLEESLKLTKSVICEANLNLIGGSTNSGKTSISKNIGKYNEFKLIDTSPAGFFEQERDLLKIWDGDK